MVSSNSNGLFYLTPGYLEALEVKLKDSKDMSLSSIPWVMKVWFYGVQW